MKKLILFLAAILCAQVYSQNRADLLSWYDDPGWNMQSDSGVGCMPGGIIRDDDTYESGYQCGGCDSSAFVQKMTVNGPFTLNAFCVAWSRTVTGQPNRTYDLVIYDTLGTGGSPGNLIVLIMGVLADNILVFPAHSRYRYDIGPLLLTMRSYYVGVRLSNNPSQFVYLSADENGTTGGRGYIRRSVFPPTWILIPEAVNFPNWKNFGIRLEGTTLSGGGPQLTLCRHGLNITLNNHSTIRDSMLVNIGQNCTLLDLNVKIDTFLSTWVADIRAYVRKSSVGVLIVNWVGGSGDNFIHTVLDDSAAISIHSGTAPFTGTYRPSNPLLPFAGVNPNGYWVFAATDSATADTGQLKAWCVILTVSCPVGGIQTVEIPNSYRLYQNYPNPFNPATKIKYGLPENANVKLTIYDILGREVKVLVNEYKHANTYEIEFDASSLTSGVYFYKLDAGDFSETKKMLMIK